MISSVDTGTKRAILVIHTFYYPLIVKGVLSINCIFKGNANVCPHFLPTVLVFLNTPTTKPQVHEKISANITCNWTCFRWSSYQWKRTQLTLIIFPSVGRYAGRFPNRNLVCKVLKLVSSIPFSSTRGGFSLLRYTRRSSNFF